MNCISDAPNGERYPLVGGTRQRHFGGANLKPRKLPENAPTPTSRVHAVLGATYVSVPDAFLPKNLAMNNVQARSLRCWKTLSRFCTVFRMALSTDPLTRSLSKRPVKPCLGSYSTTRRYSQPAGTALKWRSWLTSGSPC